MVDLSFYRGKRVLITGHSGFKGSWMCAVLLRAGAEVTGYALEPPTEPSLFNLLSLDSKLNSIRGDVRDLEMLKKAFETVKPEIVIHMAAQPIVRESYQRPVYTYEVNVMGTVNVLECIRLSDSVRTVVNVTTDKVYKNKEWEWGYRENEELNGYDPYSNSKSCSELATESYKNSFLADRNIAVSAMRAGNVIGGGDFASDRIVPDCVRAAKENKNIIVRNPYSTRPYQHVLEPVMAYLMVAEKQYKDKKLAGCYNVGPDGCDCLTTGQLADLFCQAWGGPARWECIAHNGPHEDAILRLDCAKIRAALGWQPKWHAERAVAETVAWAKAWLGKQDLTQCMAAQIRAFFDAENV